MRIMALLHGRAGKLLRNDRENRNITSFHNENVRDSLITVNFFNDDC